MLQRSWPSCIVRVIFVGFLVFTVINSFNVEEKINTEHRGGRQLLEEGDNSELNKDSVQDLNSNETSADAALFPADLFFTPDGEPYDKDNKVMKAAVLLHVLGLIYMFYALALVCDHYFVPALDVIIDKLGVSPDVAGATFMAAGGSAPELFTAVIGVFIAVSDVGIGTIVGSAVFNVLFVIAACAFASQKALDLTAWPLLRDTVFYSVALMMLVGFFIDNHIQWWEALSLLLWYGAYVGFMKVNAFCEEKFLALFPSLRKEVDPNTAVSMKFRAGFKRPLFHLMKLQIGTVTQDDDGINVQDNRHSSKKAAGIKGLRNILKGKEDKKNENNHVVTDESEFVTIDLVDTPAPKEDAKEEYQDPILSGPQGGPLKTFIYIISLPLTLPLWVTLPDMANPSRRKYFPITFLGSIIWIAGFSYLMVWWATIFGRVVGISDAVMGLTILAAGTSVPDLITSVLVAKQGHGDMAVSSSIGSNIFDVTVGLPLPWLLWSISKGGAAMNVSSAGMGCSIGMLFLMLLVVIISIIVFRWKMTKLMGGIMVMMYGVFVVVSLMLTKKIIFCPFDAL